MPVPKRYFKVSQEINHDPEMWTLTEKYGERALRTWLEILVYLDKTQNRWRMVDGWLAGLSRAVRQTPTSVSRTVGQLLANGWLIVEETSADGSPSVVKASNWAKYNRTQEQKGNGKNNSTLPSFPTPTPTPSLTFPKEKRERVHEDVTLPALNGVDAPKRKKRVLRSIEESDAPTDKHRAFALQLKIDIGPEWAKFKNDCLAHDRRYANFEAAFRNWLARHDEFNRRRNVL